MISVLFLSANPDDTTRLKLEKEYNKIDEKIRSSDYRDQFSLVQRHAVSLSTIQGHLLRFKPNIVHFSGHGSDHGKLVFENSDGHPEEADPSALSKLFEIINNDSKMSGGETIRLVILNACYSERQARAIAKHVDCVIGISNEIKDDSATNFAESFYQALGFGRSIESAFRLGRNQLGLGKDSDEKILRLNVRQGIDPSKLILIVDSQKARPSLPDELKGFTSGKLPKEHILREIDHWKESMSRPYKITIACKGKDLNFKLPVLLFRQDDSFTLLAKDGTEKHTEISTDALASRITDEIPGHALIFTNGHGVLIKDLGSKNGTLVEDTMLRGGQSATLNISDRFLVGNTFFIVKEIITEIKHIARSKELWSSFKYTYVSLLDRLVEDNDLDSFLVKLQEFRKQFEKEFDQSLLTEIDDYINESKLWLERRTSTVTRNMWRSRIRDLILRS